MKDRAALISEVQEMIRRLSQPLASSDIQDGWSEEARSLFLGTFEKLLDRLSDDTPLTDKERELNIVRGMDYWGILRGELLNFASKINVGLETAE